MNEVVLRSLLIELLELCEELVDPDDEAVESMCLRPRVSIRFI
jgi:hypothetical protein